MTQKLHYEEIESCLNFPLPPENKEYLNFYKSVVPEICYFYQFLAKKNKQLNTVPACVPHSPQAQMLLLAVLLSQLCYKAIPFLILTQSLHTENKTSVL